jgi:Taurine catabolism dioxygenase TauD, TfdA family
MPTVTSVFAPPLSARGLALGDLADAVRDVLAERHCCRIREFTHDHEVLIGLLQRFGTPMLNYGASGNRSAAYALHPAINVVKLRGDGDGDGTRTQERAGALALHSAHGYREQRPLLLAMMMADAGWTDEPEGRRGESVIVRWRDVLRWQSEHQPETADADRALLLGTPIYYGARQVDAPASTMPLLYPLVDAEEELDVGARLALELVSRIEPERTAIANFAAYRQAAERFLDAASMLAEDYLLESGELVLLDNDRFGHGRRDMVRQRPGAPSLNPRTLWSTTVDR